jgi:hypothetical protein
MTNKGEVMGTEWGGAECQKNSNVEMTLTLPQALSNESIEQFVNRLRSYARFTPHGYLCEVAADYIELLQAEIKTWKKITGRLSATQGVLATRIKDLETHLEQLNELIKQLAEEK